MSSKRDVKSYSINGRYSSLDNDQEDEPPARGDSSRSYFLNVRPENRQTFCTIIAQITEETQPGFEATLKSHSVSEESDIKFTCIVTGHPAPEITWYKDDKEMDRYCGLPKYQIFRYGKKHSLQLYKCTEDDAAIYQASARNNKGIVSCSGVLEVGTMDEYKIHQRWFARIKQKAETKRRELEQNRGKENMALAANAQRRDPLRVASPERAQRKRKSPGEANARSFDSLDNEEAGVKVHVPDLEDQNVTGTPNADTTDKPPAPAPEVQNGYVTGPQGTPLVAVKDGKPPADNSLEGLVENGISFSDYLYEAAELVAARPTGKEFAARKKKRRLSEEEGEVPMGKAEGNSQGICADNAQNGVGGSKDPGLLPSCLPDTSKRNKPHGVPRPFQSRDYMEIDKQVSSVTFGRRQHLAVPSSPKGGKEKDLLPLDCRSAKDAGPEGTKFTNDAKSAIDQEPMYSSPQSPARDVYFSMKDMYFDTIQEPKKHRQPQLPQVVETADKPSSLLRGRINRQEAVSRESVDVPNLTSAMPTCDPKRGTASEDPQTVETLGAAMDIAMPCVQSEIQNKDTFDRNIADDIRQSPEPSNRSESFECGLGYVGVSGKGAPPAFSAPLCVPDTTPRPAFQPLQPPALPHPEDKPSASLPLARGEPGEGPKASSPTQQLAREALAEVVGCKEQARPDASPVAEKAGDVHSVNGEREKLDTSNISEPKDPSGGPAAPETPASEGAQPQPSDSPGRGALPPQGAEEKQPAAGKRNQFTQTASQPGPDLGSDVEAMDVAPAGDRAPIVDVPRNPGAGPAPADNAPPEAKEATTTASQKAGCTSAEGASVDLAPPFVEATATDENVPEAVIAEAGGEWLDVDRAEEVVPEESVPGNASADSFGANIVGKFLSYLKIPSFLLGDISPAADVEKPEATPTISPVPKPPSHGALQPSKEVPHPSKSLPVAAEKSDLTDISEQNGISGEETAPATPTSDGTQPKPSGIPGQGVLPPRNAAQTRPATAVETVHPPPPALPASTERPHAAEAERGPVGPVAGAGVDHAELPAAEEPNADALILASPAAEVDLDSALPAAVPPDTPGHHRATGAPTPADTQALPRPAASVTAEPRENPAVGHTELNITGAPEEPGIGEASTLPPTLDVESPEGAVEGQGVSALSPAGGQADDYTAPCLVGTVGESAVKEVTGDGSKLLEVTCIPSEEAVSIPKPAIPSADDVLSGSESQTAKNVSDTGAAEVSQVPAIVVENIPRKSPAAVSAEDNEALKRDVPAAPLPPGSSAKIKPNDAPPVIPSATPAELASGARRKIFLPRSKQPDDPDGPAPDAPTQPKKEEGAKRLPHGQGEAGHAEDPSSLFPPPPRRGAALLQAPAVTPAAPAERRSPTVSRKMSMLEVPKLYEEPGDVGGSSPLAKGETAKDSKSASVKSEVKADEVKSTKNPFKAPQVIRKIRAEQFSDASGNLKLWCQFFNVLSDSTITWQKDGLHVDKLKRSTGDESQVSLAIVQASAKDCGVYRCVMENEYGSDATDFLFSSEVLYAFISREEIEVGEEIEMMPMLITKGLTDAGFWGNKLFGRIMTKELNFGDGFRRKASRVKVIYGLEPIFESGATCIIKVRNCISYGTKSENGLVASNHDITMQECKLQNTAREYIKIFAAEARVVEAFGPVPEILPLHLLYRPANNIPYATIEKDLNGQFMKYSMEDKSKNLTEKSGSEIELKCHTFQHWIYQWTNGNLLITDLQGVGLKITDVQIATNSKGLQFWH
uniref:alpha-protein kinase 3 isoform X2 n=1 Tax=Pristiophorus japonicus TaxID=55135 RepID=UPI00398EAC2E